MSASAFHDPKVALRRQIRSALRAFGLTPAPVEASGAIRAHLATWLAGGTLSFERITVASFAALEREPDLVPCIGPHPKLRWCFPRVEDNQLSFHGVDSAAELMPGSFGIPEPPSSNAVIPPDQIDVFLVPGLAFDPATGARLGRGRGYYDRALTSAKPDAIRVGVGFACQLATVPTEPHDEAMDAICTESGWLWIEDQVKPPR